MNFDFISALFGLHSIKLITILAALNAAYLVMEPVFTMPEWIVAVFNIIGLILVGVARAIPQPQAVAALARARA